MRMICQNIRNIGSIGPTGRRSFDAASFGQFGFSFCEVYHWILRLLSNAVVFTEAGYRNASRLDSCILFNL
jgi:hypothetical protein